MNKEQLLHIVENPLLEISSENLKQLEELVAAFPYFQGGHTLLAKAYHQAGNVFSDKKIKTAAVYTANRKKLKTFITTPTVFAVEQLSETNPPFITNLSPQSEPILVEEIKTITPATTINEEVTIELKKLQEVQKEITEPKKKALAKEKEIKEPTTTPKPKKTPVKKEKRTQEEKQKEPIKTKPKRTVNKKQNISSSRLGETLSDEKEKGKNEYSNNTPDILLEYLEHIQSKKRSSKKKDKSQFDIIDSFIEKEPSISRVSLEKPVNEQSSDLSQHSSIENTKLISENLAQIYARQGNVKKAISIYEELILKNPLKKAYFASQIEKLKK